MTRTYIRWVPSPKALQRISRWHIRLYRATRGKLGGRMDGLQILLLGTIGRKTGQPRTAPLPFFQDGDALLVVGSNGGGEKHPAWYHNLVRQPAVQVELGADTLAMQARPLSGDERARAWRNITRDQPRYADYAKKTSRAIPVIALERRAR